MMLRLKPHAENTPEFNIAIHLKNTFDLENADEDSSTSPLEWKSNLSRFKATLRNAFES